MLRNASASVRSLIAGWSCASFVAILLFLASTHRRRIRNGLLNLQDVRLKVSLLVLNPTLGLGQTFLFPVVLPPVSLCLCDLLGSATMVSAPPKISIAVVLPAAKWAGYSLRNSEKHQSFGLQRTSFSLSSLAASPACLSARSFPVFAVAADP